MNKKALALWIITIIWMIVIFLFSNSVGSVSTSKSKKITYDMVNIVEKKKTEEEKKEKVEQIHPVIRKIAHAFEYAVLCILLIISLKYSNIRNNRLYLTALLTCIVYAISDELHQLFISGRSGELRDVIIDTAGATIGLIIYDLIEKIIKIIKKKR